MFNFGKRFVISVIMKKILVFIFFLFCLLGLGGIAAITFYKPDVRRIAFDRGELIRYKVHYGFVTAGYAQMEVKDQLFKVNDKTCYKYDVTGVSTSAISWFVKVKDRWISYVDTSSMYPEKAIRDISENKYKLNEVVYFDQQADTLKRKYKKRHDTEYNIRYHPSDTKVHDIVSAYYYLRNLDFSRMSIGDKVRLSAFVEDELYDFYLVYQGKEVVRTSFGKINAIKLFPEVPNNSLFDGKNSVRFWVSDDQNRLPIKVEADMFVGAVELDIVDYSGLKYPINFASKK